MEHSSFFKNNAELVKSYSGTSDTKSKPNILTFNTPQLAG
jgi:hypothetical protein